MQELRKQLDGLHGSTCSSDRASAKARTENEQEEDENVRVEHRAGSELWKTFKNVVSLSLNMRSSGPLATILSKMREGRLEDKSWEIL